MNKLPSALRKYMENLSESNHFNGVVLVEHKNEILLKEAFGTSSFQYNVPLTTGTKFRIGSLTKAFTAMAILILHEKGKLDIFQTIDLFFPDYRHAERITIHHLLTNTSGLYNFTDSPDYWNTTMRKQTSFEEIWMSVKDRPFNFEPGEKMNYSNTGYLVLTAIIEKVTGYTYADFIQVNILDKVGLKNTGVDNGRTIVPNLATGYTVWEDVIHTEFVDMTFPLGAYGMYSCAEDLSKWSKALTNHELIDKVLRKEMFTSFKGGYGYGWYIDIENEMASHFGDINGFVSHIVLDLNREITTIVLSNITLTPVTKISNDLMNIVLEKDQPDNFSINKAEIQDVQNLVGTYFKGSETIEISWERQDLFAIVPKMYGVPYKLRLSPIQTNQFVSDFIREKYTFSLGNRLEYVDCYGYKSVYKKF